MKASLAAAVAISVVAMIVVAAFFVTQHDGATTETGVTTAGTGSQTISTSTSTTSSSISSSTGPTTSTGSAGPNATANDPNGLQVQLSLRFYPGEGANGSAMVGILADDHNTLPTMNNVSVSSAWSLGGLSLGPCGRDSSPYGVALYSGAYTAANVSLAQPLSIYPTVACPMYVRLVTGYLFQPASDNALILPGSGNATEMFSMVNATGVYASDAGMGASPTPLPPGTYTAAAGDEWGAVVVMEFTISADGAASLIG